MNINLIISSSTEFLFPGLAPWQSVTMPNPQPPFPEKNAKHLMDVVPTKTWRKNSTFTCLWPKFPSEKSGTVHKFLKDAPFGVFVWYYLDHIETYTKSTTVLNSACESQKKFSTWMVKSVKAWWWSFDEMIIWYQEKGNNENFQHFI